VRLPSGVPGFDALVQGGFPTGTAVVVQGPADKEKDTFLFQFVVEGLQKGGAALIVLSSVSPAKYEQELRDAGVDVDVAFAENRLKFVDWFTYKEEAVQDVQQEGSVYRASIDLANVGIAVSRAIAALPREGEKRAAVEILSPALSVYDLPAVYGFAQSTKAKLERFGFTALFVLEKEMHDDRTLSSLHQPFDGVVDIERVREGDELVRKVAVLSLKGTAAQSKYVPLDMGPDRVLRVSAMSERERTLRRQEDLIKSNPKDPKLWLATARNLRAMGEMERALKCVEAALNLDAKDEESWRFKAELLDALGRPGEAAQARARAAPVVPAPRKDEASTRLLGVVETRLRQNPRDPDALFVKGAALAKIEDLTGALQALEALATVDDAYPGLWVLKAKLHARRGERDKAQEARLRSQEVERRQLAREKEARTREPPPPRDAVFECPECSAAVGEHDTVCPNCGVVFEGVEEPPEPKREVPPPTPKPELARRGFTNGLARESPRGVGRTNGLVNGTRGRTNGLVNGTRGRTNGLVNGTRGRTNGLVNGTRGRTNGLVNGTRGRTNGLVNGTRGRTNGVTNGLVNGLRSLRAGMTNGLTNGSGFTNGLGSQRYARELRRNRWKLFLIPAVFAALVAAPLLNGELGGPGGPVIDGSFEDWAGVPSIPLAPTANNTNVALTRVAFSDATSRLSLLVEVQGQMLAGGPAPSFPSDVIIVFVDSDRSAATGYPIRGLGADRLLEVSGHGGTVVRATLYRFSLSVPDRRDWRGWTDSAPIAAAAGGNRLEMAVDWLLLADTPGAPLFLVGSLGWNGATDLADLTVSPGAAHVRIVQRHSQPAVLTGANVPLLTLELTAVDVSAAVAGLTVDLVGTAPLSAVSLLQVLDGTGTPLAQRVPVGASVAFAFPAVTLAPGVPQTWTIVASVSGSSGQTLGAELPEPSAVQAGSAAVTLSTISSGDRLGYLGQTPASPIVDGAFAEWTGDFSDGAGEATIFGNPSIDLTRFGAIPGAANLTFHVSVRGPAFAGTVLTTQPPTTVVPGPGAPDRDRDTVPDDGSDLFPDDFDNDGTPDAQEGGDHDSDGITDYPFGGPDYWLNTTIPGSFVPPYAGRNVSVYVGPTYLPPVIGEDRVRLFVDADNVSATGYYIQGIGADYLIQITGRDGVVAAANLSAHSGGNPWTWDWTWRSDLTLATGLTEFEARADLTALVPDPAYFLEVSDWRGGTDTVGVGTRGMTRSALLFDGPSVSFVPTSGGAFAYQTTGADLEAYARAARGPDPELVLRYGSLFLGWRTTGLLGVADDGEALVGTPVRAVGRNLAIGGLPGAWEAYEASDSRVKHNVWIASAPDRAADVVGIEGVLTVPDQAVVLVDGQPVNESFATPGDIVIVYDGYAVRLNAPFAYESARPESRVTGQYRGTRDGTSIRLAMEVPAAWMREPSRSYPIVLDPTATGIVDTSSSSTPTGGPHQRNVFHDGTYFWAFFYDGTTIQYEPSSDGLSWVNAKTAAFTTTNVVKVSTWFHASGSIVYIAGAVGSDKDVRVRRGTISGTTITWGSEVLVTLSGANNPLSPFIMRDASGYIWAASNDKEGNGQFTFAVARSTNTDDVSAWGARTTLMTSIANDFVQGVVLPLSSGDAYAVWYADGTIYGKRYTASNTTWWTNGDTIDTTTAGVLTKAPSAVVDGSFYIHLVYVDSSGAVKYRQRTTSWGSATTLDASSGNTYATISRDSGTGDLYVFYVSSTNQIKAQRYSGSWSAVTLETNTKAKSSLTSVYSGSSTTSIGWAWGQGSASPYDAKFSVLSTTLTSRTIDTSTDSSPVSFNHQRKVFHDNAGHFWAFYFDGSNTVYTWSVDGVTWENTVSQAFTTTGVDNPSVWFHDTGSTKIVYAVGDSSSNDATLNVRRGTISGTTITWGTEATATIGTQNLASKVTFITRDSSGYLWIVTNKKSSPSTYNVGVIRSTSTDDVSSWGSVTDLLTAAISGSQVYPLIVPLSSGNVYALWYADGAIDGKLYSGSWGSLETIATTTAGVSTKIPSAVVDGSGNIELAYINSTGAVLHKQRTSSWGSATTVDSGTGSTSPTITRHSGTGDLYVFYLLSTYQIKGRTYSGSWSDISGIDTSTITKVYITSPYTITAAWKVSWLWGQGGSSPYEVKIARLPEFEDIVVPIAAMAGLVFGLRAWRRRRGERRA